MTFLEFTCLKKCMYLMCIFFSPRAVWNAIRQREREKGEIIQSRLCGENTQPGEVFRSIVACSYPFYCSPFIETCFTAQLWPSWRFTIPLNSYRYSLTYVPPCESLRYRSNSVWLPPPSNKRHELLLTYNIFLCGSSFWGGGRLSRACKTSWRWRGKYRSTTTRFRRWWRLSQRRG